MGTQKIVGFDLDGVIATRDEQERKQARKKGSLQDYYNKRELTNIGKWLAKEKETHDKVVIATSRTERYHKLTTSWLAEKGLGDIETLFLPRELKKTRKNITNFKLSVIKDKGLSFFIEDDEVISRRLTKKIFQQNLKCAVFPVEFFENKIFITWLEVLLKRVI